MNYLPWTAKCAVCFCKTAYSFV